MMLTDGFQPCNLVPPGFSTQALEGAAATADYNHISVGGTLVQYADILAIQGHQNLVLPNSTLGVGIHIRMAFITLATLLGHLHLFTISMRSLLEEWVGAEMELPSLLAPIANGPATCVFWMTLRFHCFFQVAQNLPGQGPLAVSRMTKLTEQLHLHVFAQLAPPLPVRYLPATQPAPWGPMPSGPKTPRKEPGDEPAPACSTRNQMQHSTPLTRPESWAPEY